jgi:hypothetical protein
MAGGQRKLGAWATRKTFHRRRQGSSPEREDPELGRVLQSFRDCSRPAISKPVESARVLAGMPLECNIGDAVLVVRLVCSVSSDETPTAFCFPDAQLELAEFF